MKRIFILAIVGLIIAMCSQNVLAQQTANEYFKYGYEQYLKNEPEKALEYFNKSIELNPNSANTLFIRATTHLLLKHYDNAVTDYENAMKVGYPNKNMAYKYIAEAYMLQGDKEKGMQYMEKSKQYPAQPVIDVEKE